MNCMRQFCTFLPPICDSASPSSHVRKHLKVKSEKLFGYFFALVGWCFALWEVALFCTLFLISRAHIHAYSLVVIGMTFCHLGEGVWEGGRTVKVKKGGKSVKESGGAEREKEGETSVFRGHGGKNTAEGAGNRGYFGKNFFREAQVRKCLIDKMS